MPKPCIALNCTNNIFSTGFCRTHQHLSPPQEKRTPKDRGLFVRNAEPVDDSYDKALNAWFKAREKDIIDSGSVCFECGEYISKAYYRHATAHLFPKKIFKSVATHPLNFIVLGAGCGHHSKFDHSIDRASKMGIWPEAVERAMQFIHLIKEKHQYLTLYLKAFNIITNKPLSFGVRFSCGGAEVLVCSTKIP